MIRSNPLLQVFIGGGDKPTLARMGRVLHTLKFALLQDAQQFCLQRRESSPNSSRKSVPPSATSNLPRFCATAPVNEPFSCRTAAFEQRFGECRAVDCDEWV